MSNNYLSLDWRNGPPPKEIVHRLEQVFTDVDDETKSGTTLRLSQSTAKKAYSVVEKNGHPIVMRHDNSSHKAYNGQVKFWSEAYTIAVSLVDMQAQEQMLKIRFIQYREVFPNTSMTLDQVKRILTDLALTIKVHPLALGFLAEDRGKFYLPEGTLIDATVVSNIIAYHKADVSAEFAKKKTFKHEQGSSTSIPQLVERLKVRIQNKRSVRAVIITEHANLSSLLMDDQFDVNNCIVITLSGYPGYSTCEWIHMLSIDPLLQHLPWLMLIDHDFQGFHIFSKVKYGCRSSAWVSEISVCSQLQCIGPFRDDLTQSPALHRPDWEAQHRADYPRKDDSAVAKAADEWEARCDRKIMRKFTAASAVDKSLYKSFERTGWLQYEPGLKGELRTMLKQPSKFRLADLTQVSTRYLQTFLETKIEEKSPAKTAKAAVRVEVRVPARRSPVGERFKQIPSQIQDSGSVSLAKAAVEDSASAEPELTETQLEALVSDPVADMI
ncbi:hypothetical protein HO173_012170 [Letharia columbiana]|uniref:Topoisomerase 6 subunit A/Spo11 TOPRIM domain-containing protein n=1 Tax=Letharia columbiana TaxID=112416 RepID=A0A8H6CQL8_9LECA|nr:uncharacterized protein HO173_012170 [Letharia columbiana]KAF6227531.1 hypothetical protein HO173_012170 [Letharia columbiana]